MSSLHSQEAATERARQMSYFPPDCGSWPQWAEDAERRINAATISTFDAAGVTADSDGEEAVALLLMHLGIDEDCDADVAEVLCAAALARFERVRELVYEALDAACL
jgi:hypothetical protein